MKSSTTPPGFTLIILQTPRNAESFSSLSRMFRREMHLFSRSHQCTYMCVYVRVCVGGGCKCMIAVLIICGERLMINHVSLGHIQPVWVLMVFVNHVKCWLISIQVGIPCGQQLMVSGTSSTKCSHHEEADERWRGHGGRVGGRIDGKVRTGEKKQNTVNHDLNLQYKIDTSNNNSDKK